MNLLLENEFDINKCFNENAQYILDIFNESNVDKKKEPMYLYLQNKYKFHSIFNKSNRFLNEKYFHHLEKSIFPTIDIKFYPQNLFNKTSTVTQPEMCLFLWCILTNRLDIAKIFWRLGNVIGNSFFNLFNYL